MAKQKKVKDIMTKGKKLVTVAPGDKVRDARKAMVSNSVSGLPVVDDDDNVAGFVTEQDVLTVRNTTNVETVMTKRVKKADPDDRVIDIARRMEDEGLKHLPVEKDDGTLWGVVSRRDVIDEKS